MKKFIIVMSAISALSVPMAQAKIEAESCSIKVIQFYDRVYEGFEYIDEETLALFRHPQLGNFSNVELVDSIISPKDKKSGKTRYSEKSYLKLYNQDVEDAYLEAIKQNVDSGEYYATFKTSCGKHKRDDYMQTKNDDFKWRYKCKLSMSIGQYTEDDDGDSYTNEIAESSNRTVKLKIKGQLSLEEQEVIDDLRDEKQDILEDSKAHRISKSTKKKRLKENEEDYQEEIFEPLRRDNLPEMRDQYRKMIEKFLKKKKFQCKERQ